MALYNRGMSRNRITLTKAQRAELRVAYDTSRDGLTRMRMLGVRLYGEGERTERIIEIVGCSRSSLMNWLRAYRIEGVIGLYDKRKGGNAAKLSTEQLEHLQNQVHQYTPKQLFSQDDYVGSGDYWSVPTVTTLIERTYGVVYTSPNSYRNLLKQCGLSLQKPATEYRSRSVFKVMDFEEQLEKNCLISPKMHQKP